MKRAENYAVVIPAYNEAATIREVALSASRVVPLVVVIDDGSNDGMRTALAGAPIVLLANEKNLGKAASLRRGIEYALEHGVQAVITLDGDGQHDPADIVKLIAAHRAQPDAIVIASRLIDRHNAPRPRYYANRFANFWIAWAAGYPISDSQSGFRLYPAAVLRATMPCCDTRASFVFESEVLIEAGRRGHCSIAVLVPSIYRTNARASHFRPVADIVLIVRMVAWKLVSRGLCLPGLIRSLRRPGGMWAHDEQERRTVRGEK